MLAVRGINACSMPVWRERRTIRRSARCAPSPAVALDEYTPEEYEKALPRLLNNTPHSRETRYHFYGDATASVVKAVRAGERRMQVFVEFPELNVEQDVFRIGTLLEMIREMTIALAADGKTVRVCVQQSMGTGVFQALPLMLTGVKRVLDMMDWGENEPGNKIRLGSIGEEEVVADDDAYIMIAPQNIQGYSVLPYLQAHCAAADQRPVILINPRLNDIASSNNVMSIRGRSEREAYQKSFTRIHHFRLLYTKPFFFPIYGCLRKPFDGDWSVYKRLGKGKTEDYSYIESYPQEPTKAQLTEAILKTPGN
mmetsp:Transcript_4318/g.14936  ORF Transcript_4318/g.14936 Transcript_4318/m.14936 type:complete len:311 (+) Transcript_4318:28-960(+)